VTIGSWTSQGRERERWQRESGTDDGREEVPVLSGPITISRSATQKILPNSIDYYPTEIFRQMYRIHL